MAEVKAERRWDRTGAALGSVMVGCRCGSCDLDPELLDPWLLAALLRSLPDRYARLFNREMGGCLSRARPAPDVWSASEHAAYAARVAEAAAAGVARVMTGQASGKVAVAAPRAGNNRAEPAAAIAALEAGIAQLAAAVELVTAVDWLIGVRYQRELWALELIRRAVHEVTHHIDEARRVMDELGLRPAGDGGGTRCRSGLSDGLDGPRTPGRSGLRPGGSRYRGWQW